MKKSKVAFQGELGAYSHLACEELFPDSEIKTCPTFEETFKIAFNVPFISKLATGAMVPRPNLFKLLSQYKSVFSNLQSEKVKPDQLSFTHNARINSLLTT